MPAKPQASRPLIPSPEIKHYNIRTSILRVVRGSTLLNTQVTEYACLPQLLLNNKEQARRAVLLSLPPNMYTAYSHNTRGVGVCGGGRGGGWYKELDSTTSGGVGLCFFSGTQARERCGRWNRDWCYWLMGGKI